MFKVIFAYIYISGSTFNPVPFEDQLAKSFTSFNMWCLMGISLINLIT